MGRTPYEAERSHRIRAIAIADTGLESYIYLIYMYKVVSSR